LVERSWWKKDRQIVESLQQKAIASKDVDRTQMDNIATQAAIASRELDLLAKEKLGALSQDQLNWSPDGVTWSIGQQFEHMVLGNKIYVDVIARLAEVAGPASKPYRPGFWGRKIIAACSPEDKMPAPVPRAMRPTAGPHGQQIVDEYFAIQDRYYDLLNRLEDKDLTVGFSSPFAWFAKMQLGDAVQIVERHNARHLSKALALQTLSDFPH
jgi:hypothetical protein